MRSRSVSRWTWRSSPAPTLPVTQVGLRPHARVLKQFVRSPHSFIQLGWIRVPPPRRWWQHWPAPHTRPTLIGDNARSEQATRRQGASGGSVGERTSVGGRQPVSRCQGITPHEYRSARLLGRATTVLSRFHGVAPHVCPLLCLLSGLWSALERMGAVCRRCRWPCGCGVLETVLRFLLMPAATTARLCQPRKYAALASRTFRRGFGKIRRRLLLGA